MRTRLWARPEGTEDRRREFDGPNSYDMDPPTPVEIFTRLGVLLVIALAFGLAAELLGQIPN